MHCNVMAFNYLFVTSEKNPVCSKEASNRAVTYQPALARNFGEYLYGFSK